jgi:hypothetical protein
MIMLVRVMSATLILALTPAFASAQRAVPIFSPVHGNEAGHVLGQEHTR